MYRRVFGSGGIPFHQWHVLNISSMKQANRMCPSLVPMISTGSAAALSATSGTPLAEALSRSSAKVNLSAINSLLVALQGQPLSTVYFHENIMPLLRWVRVLSPAIENTSHLRKSNFDTVVPTQLLF